MNSINKPSEASQETRRIIDLRTAFFLILTGVIVGGSCEQLIRNGADREMPSKPNIHILKNSKK